MSDAPLLDRPTIDRLLESVDGDREFLAELATTFLRDGAELLGNIRTSVASGDLQGARRAAHTLKSTAASLGALRLADMSRETEQLANAHDLVGAGNAVAPMEEHWAEVVTALERLALGGEDR